MEFKKLNTLHIQSCLAPLGFFFLGSSIGSLSSMYLSILSHVHLPNPAQILPQIFHMPLP